MAKTSGPTVTPSLEDYATAFAGKNFQITDRQCDVLDLLYQAPGHTLTAAEMAAALGYSSYVTANAMLGRLGAKIANEIGFEPQKRHDGTPMQWQALATDGTNGAKGKVPFRWRMRAELVSYIDSQVAWETPVTEKTKGIVQHG